MLVPVQVFCNKKGIMVTYHEDLNDRNNVENVSRGFHHTVHWSAGTGWMGPACSECNPHLGTDGLLVLMMVNREKALSC